MWHADYPYAIEQAVRKRDGGEGGVAVRDGALRGHQSCRSDRGAAADGGGDQLRAGDDDLRRAGGAQRRWRAAVDGGVAAGGSAAGAGDAGGGAAEPGAGEGAQAGQTVPFLEHVLASSG